MGNKKKSEHFHKYEKFTWPNKRIYYKCMMPGCTHYLPIADNAIGRESLCWGADCNNLVTITKEDITREVFHPMCEVCKEERRTKLEDLRRLG